MVLRSSSKAPKFLLFASAGSVLSGLNASFAQDSGALDTQTRPGQNEIETPEPAGQADLPQIAQNPALVSPGADFAGNAAQLSFTVNEISFIGAGAINVSALDEIAAPYLGTRMSTADIAALRQEITLAYVNAGYFSSGAVIEDQDVSDGNLEITVVEGRLGDLEVRGLEAWRPGQPRKFVVERPFKALKRRALNGQEVSRAFRQVANDPSIASVAGTIDPGVRPGQANITLDVDPASPFFAKATLANDRSPAIGGQRATLSAGMRNLVGFGDTLEASASVTEGSEEYSVSASLPLPIGNTRAHASVSYADSEVVSEPFSELDILSETWTYSAGLETNILSRPGLDVSLGSDIVRVESEGSFLGLDLSLSPGQRNGRVEYTASRFNQSVLWRSERQALSARSTFTFGLDAVSPIDVNEFTPPEDFIAWRGELMHQWRVTQSGQRLVSQLDVQVSQDPLFATEKFSVGGPSSVGGYRVNSQVADGGVLAKLTYLVPLSDLGMSADTKVLRAPARDINIGVVLAAGEAVNFDQSLADTTGLTSIGLTARWRLDDTVRLRIDLAKGLSGQAQFADEQPQDYGITARLDWSF